MDQKLLAEIKELFMTEMSMRIKLLGQHVADEELQQVRQVAHMIRGAGGTYGFPEISEYGGTVEEAAKAENWDLIKSGLNQLESWLELNT